MRGGVVPVWARPRHGPRLALPFETRPEGLPESAFLLHSPSTMRTFHFLSFVLAALVASCASMGAGASGDSEMVWIATASGGA